MIGHEVKKREGFTVAELLVAITFFVIVLGIVVGGFTQGVRSQRRIASMISVNNNISLVLEQIAREIRVGRNFCQTVDTSPAIHTCAVPLPIDPATFSSETDFIEFERLRGANLTTVRYEFDAVSGQVLRSEGGAAAVPITAPNVLVSDLGFMVSEKRDDPFPWRITVRMTIAPTNAPTGQMEEHVQTTISARFLPCEADPLFCAI